MRKAPLLCIAVMLSVWTQVAPAQTPPDVAQFNQEAGGTSALTRMHDYFAHTAEMEFKTSFFEASDLPGMNRSGIAHFVIRRPNSFRVELTSNNGDYVFVSDGTTFTIFQPTAARYTRIPARDSIIGTMYTAIGLLGTQARLIDFLWTIDYGENVSVKGLGTDTVGGKTCDRFSVQRFENNWDIWLDRVTAVPCKLISRKSDANDRSVQTNEFAWVAVAAIGNDTFLFSPPKGNLSILGHSSRATRSRSVQTCSGRLSLESVSVPVWQQFSGLC